MEMASFNVLCHCLNVQVPDSDSVPANAPPPSSFKQSFPQRKAKVAAIVIVIVVKTYKIQGRKPEGESKKTK